MVSVIDGYMPPLDTSSKAHYGLFLTACSVCFVQMMNAGAKFVSEQHDPVESAFYRGVVGLTLMLLWLLYTGRWELLKTNRPVAHLSRSVVGNLNLCLVFYSFALMPMASASSMFLTSGLFVVLLSPIFLKERITSRRLLAVLIGLAGSLIVIRPGAGDISVFAFLVGMTGAISTAAVAFMLRKLGETEHAFTSVFYFMLTGVIGAGVYMPFNGHLPSLDTILPLIIVGAAALASLLCKTEAFRYAEASYLTPVTYTALIWATLFGWLLFKDVPDYHTIVGAAIIVLANMLVVLPSFKGAPK